MTGSRAHFPDLPSSLLLRPTVHERAAGMPGCDVSGVVPQGDPGDGSWVGVLAALADIATAHCVVGDPTRTAARTASLRLDLVRSRDELPAGSRLVARAELLDRTDDTGLSGARVTLDDALVAVVVARFLLVRPSAPSTGPAVPRVPAGPPPARVAESFGLLGVRDPEHSGGSTRMGIDTAVHPVAFAPTTWLDNTFGAIQGGLQLGLAEVAARQGLRLPGSARLLDITSTYYAPAVVQPHAELVLRVRQRRRTRRLVVADVVIPRPDGRVASSHRLTVRLPETAPVATPRPSSRVDGNTA